MTEKNKNLYEMERNQKELEKIIEERDNEILELMAEVHKFEREKPIEPN